MSFGKKNFCSTIISPKFSTDNYDFEFYFAEMAC